MNKNSNSKLSTNTSITSSNALNNKVSNKVSNLAETSYINLTNIKNNIKNKLSSNLRSYLIFAIPVIILLCYFLYKYNLSSRATQIISNMGYKKTIQLEQLPQCYQLDQSIQYKLCDYYIASSYMTPCIGNQHYDYVSTDMIIEVIQSGARYIQIPICEADVSLQAIPVVGTAQYGQKVITSLNTLDVTTVLNIIRANAFKINNKQINYPIIIHFILNTNNAYTLEVLGDIIQTTISDVLVNVENYKKFPIFLEKLCNLLGKIIIFATPEYQGTKLEPYIVPINKMFEVYHYSEIVNISLPTNSAYTTYYNNKLSTKQQTKTNKIFKEKYPSIDYVIQNQNTIGAAILNDTDILNNLMCFNKIGMTIIKPQNPTDVVSTNYDTTESIFYGCQFNTMNYQINDTNMQNYLNIFKDSSFRLKPASLRFSDIEEPMPDLLAIYQAIIPKNNNIINDIYYKYNNLLIALEPYLLDNTYLTQIESNLRFSIGSNSNVDKYGNKTYKIGLNQCFLINKSTIGTGAEDIPLFLESAINQNELITFNTNYFDIEPKGNTKIEINKQSFYFEKSKVLDNEQGGELVSLRIIDPNNTMYLAFENKQAKAYPNSPQIEAQNNMSFILHIIPFQIQIKLITLYDGSIKTMGGAILGILENNNSDGTGYILEPTFKTSGKNFIFSKDQFYMKNIKTNTYVVYDNTTFFLYDKAITPNSNCIFNLAMSNGFYTVINNIGQNLIFYNTNLLKFVKTEEIVSNENLFKIDLQYII
jgi:hypothetical protein